MDAAIDWVYPRRDPFAWMVATCLGGFVLWLMLQPITITKRTEDRVLALVEERLPSPVVSDSIRSLPPPEPRPEAQARQSDQVSPVPTIPAANPRQEAPIAQVRPVLPAPRPPQPLPLPQPGVSNATGAVVAPPPSPSPAEAAAEGAQAPEVERALIQKPPIAAEPIASVANAAALTPAPPTTETSSARTSAGYEALLLALIERAKRYPNSREARQTRPQGTSRIWLELGRDGQLRATGLVASSGSNLLDNHAIGTVRSVSFPAFPENAFAGQDAHRFTVSIKFELRTE